MLVQPIFTPVGFGSQLGEYGWVFVLAAVSGLIAKENVISTFGTLAACLIANPAVAAEIGLANITSEAGVGAVKAMILATGISVPGLLAFIAFNMTTIPCFAAVGTAKAELQDKKRYKWTLLFWIATFLRRTPRYGLHDRIVVVDGVHLGGGCRGGRRSDRYEKQKTCGKTERSCVKAKRV